MDHTPWRARVWRWGATPILAAMLACPLSAGPSAAVAVSYPAVADSFVSSVAPDKNMGTWGRLRADTSPILRAYLRFDLTGLTGSVTSATLRVYAAAGHPAGYQVRAVGGSSWGETTITYRNAPAPSADVTSVSGAFKANAWTSADVTPLVNAAIGAGGPGAISLALTGTNSTEVVLYSRNAPSNRPQLVVTTTAADTSPPSAPTDVSATAEGPRRVDLSWTPSTDDRGVAGYTIHRDGRSIGSVGPQATAYTDTSVSPTTSYRYEVEAVDGAGNRSPRSQPATVTTGPVLDEPIPRFGPSGLDGGGFVNVLAMDPHGSGLVLAGGDVSGFHRSTDRGATWEAANSGVREERQLSVASIAFSPTVAGKVYAGVGDKGVGGGLLVSMDAGRSWTVRSTAPQFSGTANGGVVGVPSPHPRSTGNLIAVDDARGLVYAATFDDGLMRSDDDGATWTTLGLAGTHLRSIALDPEDPSVLYAAPYGDGVYRTTDGPGTGSFAKLAGAPGTVEELLALPGPNAGLYAVGPGGVFRSTDRGDSWTALGSGSLPSAGWAAIDGSVACEEVVLYAASASGGAHSVVRSVDGGASWEILSDDPASISPEVGGSGGPDWWQSSSWWLGGGSYVGAQLQVDPASLSDDCVPERVLLAGRSGVWGSGDGGQRWYPLVRGMGLTIARGLAIDRAAPGRLGVGVSDWEYLHSVDGGERFALSQPPGAGSVTFDLAFDAGSAHGRVYIATGNFTADVGEVFANADPGAGGTWVDEGLSQATGGKTPLAVAVGREGTTTVVLAAVDGAGVWRKAGIGWSRVSSTAMGKRVGPKAASMAWAPAGGTVYLYDRVTGVWRSSDAGRTWTKIWSKPSTAAHTGHLAVDPVNPERLYVSVGGTGVYRLNGATSGSVDAGTLSAVPVGSFARPGPIAVSPDGTLYVAELAGGGADGSLSRSADSGQTWEDVTDDAYRSAAAFPDDLVVPDPGTVYVALNGNGVIIGRPSP